MLRGFVFAVCSAFVLSAGQIEARSARVNQIPNGSVNGCGNCHTNPNGGGARNAFGSAINNGFLSASGRNGTVVWNATLANQDSDGDGFSNGTELGDPDGDGTPTVGAQVTNPGLASSVPQVINNAPAFGNLGTQTVNEGEDLAFTVTATDQDNDTVTITAGDLPAGATFENGTLSWTPGFDQAGAYTLNFTASDGSLETSLQVQVAVDNVARPLAISSFAPTRDLLVVATGDTVRMNVIATAEDLSGVTYAWTVNGVSDAETGSSLLLNVSAGDSDDRVSVSVSGGTSSLARSWTVSKTLKGDFNGNNVVDFPDFLAFVIAFGRSSADAGFNASMDLSGNGSIDFSDFLTFVSFFGLTQ